MGEIAEMMIDGTLCECCGCFIDDDIPGFPRYCSKECAADRGVKWDSTADGPRKPKEKKPDPALPKKVDIGIWRLHNGQIAMLAWKNGSVYFGCILGNCSRLRWDSKGRKLGTNRQHDLKQKIEVQ